MAVLVAYASEHGSTREIAERIAARLGERRLAAQVRDVAGVDSLAGFDSAVIGSAIHSGDWLPEGAQFLDRHRAALASRPVWLFSVSCVGEESSAFPPRVAKRMRSMTGLPKSVAAGWQSIHPRGHHAFAGVIRPDHWGFSGRMFLRSFGGRFGDHRNWREIDGWAASIAGALRPVPHG